MIAYRLDACIMYMGYITFFLRNDIDVVLIMKVSRINMQ